MQTKVSFSSSFHVACASQAGDSDSANSSRPVQKLCSMLQLMPWTGHKGVPFSKSVTLQTVIGNSAEAGITKAQQS
jgi:hypothetical protein